MTNKTQPKGIKVANLSAVSPETVDWIWENYIPDKKITLIGGLPGSGKTFMLVDLAGRIANGKQLPSGGTKSPKKVLLITGEDGLADTIVQRLIDAGHDRSNIDAVDIGLMVDSGDILDLTNSPDVLEQTIIDNNIDVVIIDPLMAFTGDADTNQVKDARKVTTALTGIAEQLRIAIIGVIHVNKNTEASAPIHRMMGAQDWAAAARAVLFVGQSKDSDNRYLVPVKLNIVKAPDSQIFKIENGVVRWIGPTQMSADELLSPASPQQSKKRTAKELLQSLLADGPMHTACVERIAKAHGHSASTVNRAKKQIGVTSTRIGTPGGKQGSGYYELSLPAASTQTTNAAPDPKGDIEQVNVKESEEDSIDAA